MKFALTFIILVVVITAYIFFPASKPYHPQGSPNILGQNLGKLTQKNYRIAGFLPYWNVDKLTTEAQNNVTDLIYFALTMDENGEIVKYQNRNEMEPGWRGFGKFKDINNHNQFVLAIQMLDNAEIISLLSDADSQRQAIDTIVSLTKDNNLKGINIDFEPTGSISRSDADNFTLFIENLNQALHKNKLSYIELSVDIYPTIVGKNRLWDLPRLAPHLAYVVVMTYDYHYRGSDTAGPVSPLRGATEHFNDDISTNLRELSQFIPPEKLVFGIPFYGYRWKTVTDEKYSQTLGKGITAPIKEIEPLISAENTSLHWDRNSLTPYLIIKENSKTSQIYFENTLSLGLKLDLVKLSRYQGIAIWALGYEDENSPLWQTISDKLKK